MGQINTIEDKTLESLEFIFLEPVVHFKFLDFNPNQDPNYRLRTKTVCISTEGSSFRHISLVLIGTVTIFLQSFLIAVFFFFFLLKNT